MRSSTDIIPADPDETYVWGFDQLQVDNPHRTAFKRLGYLARMDRIVDTVARNVSHSARVADVGCAQGNVAIALAERGFHVWAYDLNPSFLAYARKKQERGDITWVQANAFEIGTPDFFDCVILAELVEHVAHPDQLIAHALGLLRIGGILVITTPNGKFIREKLPSYGEAIAEVGLPRMEREQFGPGGEHHLFAYTLRELLSHVPVTGLLDSVRFVGSGLYNSHAQWLLDGPLIGRAYCKIADLVTRVPVLRVRLGLTLMMVIRRVG
jgi:2-polyprenyl-6-hydroxyphenyl methylase/3-demethylubiquinone-9 3-methyltransferase